ncbi:hypothetical protein LZ30DRAFT_42637 [Colletotrichum cereale]|nr:hypothetical protein LZ30DRAFT_42637 [Colletotrichum cereale]
MTPLKRPYLLYSTQLFCSHHFPFLLVPLSAGRCSLRNPRGWVFGSEIRSWGGGGGGGGDLLAKSISILTDGDSIWEGRCSHVVTSPVRDGDQTKATGRWGSGDQLPIARISLVCVFGLCLTGVPNCPTIRGGGMLNRLNYQRTPLFCFPFLLQKTGEKFSNLG